MKRLVRPGTKRCLPTQLSKRCMLKKRGITARIIFCSLYVAECYTRTKTHPRRWQETLADQETRKSGFESAVMSVRDRLKVQRRVGQQAGTCAETSSGWLYACWILLFSCLSLRYGSFFHPALLYSYAHDILMVSKRPWRWISFCVVSHATEKYFCMFHEPDMYVQVTHFQMIWLSWIRLLVARHFVTIHECKPCSTNIMRPTLSDASWGIMQKYGSRVLSNLRRCKRILSSAPKHVI